MLLLPRLVNRYPRMRPWLALLGAGLAALITSSFALGMLIAGQLENMRTMQSQGLANLTVLRDEINTTLERLARDFEPECSEANLYALRKVIFFSRTVGDIGILDEKDQLVCSTAIGILPQALPMPAPDAVYRAPSTGFSSRIFLDVSVAEMQRQEKATVIAVGRFDVIVNPFSTAPLLLGGASAVQISPDEAPVRTVLRNPALQPDWVERLREPAYANARPAGFDWKEMAFVAVDRLPRSVFVIQSVVTWDDFLAAHNRQLKLSVVAALVIGSLCYLVARQHIDRWSGLEHRIASLLIPQNIVCHYQPIVDLQTGATLGCEVLFRLRDGPTVLYPDSVLPAVIQRHLTWQLDQLVVSTALSELTRHLPDLRSFQIAFNFFPENIELSKITSLFGKCLAHTPHDGLQFEIEVIEEAYGASLAKEAASLKEKGFLISVDDFGTGYSNLASVKALAPDLLKIDRSFVMEMEDQSLRSSMIEEIVLIANAVGAKVIAEGVENASQATLLREKGVQFGQGYWFARPMPIEQLSVHMRT